MFQRYTALFLVVVMLLVAVPISHAAPLNQAVVPVTGKVYHDLNGDGLLTLSGGIVESGVDGVTVVVRDSTGMQIGSSISNATGDYTITPTGALPYRLEFSTFPAGYGPSYAGGQNGTSVQFITNAAQAAAAHFGVLNPQEYTPALPDVAIPILPVGSGTGKTSTTTAPTYLSYPYSADGITTPVYSPDAVLADTGVVWGAAFQRDSGIMFAAAVLKRHSDVGALVRPAVGAGVSSIPIDGIYMLNYAGDLGGSYLGGFTLNGVTPAAGNAGVIATGTVQRENVTGAVGSRPNALSTTDPESFDVDAFDKVGTVGFGDVDMSADGTQLWVVNLNQRSLIRIDASTPLSVSGALDGSRLAHYSIDFSGLPTCAGEFRPWALKFKGADGFVGVVCDASAGADDDLSAYVLRFDPVSPASFTVAVTVNLDPAVYIKESSQYAVAGALAGDCTLGTQQGWNRWATSWSDFGALPTQEFTCPQPILSNIEIDANGDMILSFLDRSGLQFDYANYGAAVSAAPPLYTVNSGGDIIHVCKTATGYAVEGFADCVIDGDTFGITGTPPGSTNATRILVNDGPNGVGEFYYHDYSLLYDSSAPRHVENHLGSVALLPGTGEVFAAGYDVITGEYNQGVQVYRTRTATAGLGGLERAYQFRPDNTVPFNSKGSHMGDIEFITTPAPLEVGNRVWGDIDQDGEQDAGESGLISVTVSLFDGAMIDELASTVTDANGNYYFTVAPTGSYCIKIDTSQGGLTGYVLTGANVVSDTIDSDPVMNGSIAVHCFASGAAGQNDHSIDAGFYPTLVSFGNYVWYDANKDGVQDETELPAANIKVCAETPTGEPILDQNEQPLCTTTDSNGLYLFVDLPPASYCAHFDLDTLPSGYSVTVQNAFSNTVDSADSDADPATGLACETGIIPANEQYLDLDMGIYLVDGCVGDYVWHDSNINGIQDSGENPFPNVIAELFTVSGVSTGITDTTDVDGSYLLCSEPGQYYVQFSLSGSASASPSDQGGNDTADSDVDPVTLKTPVFVLSAGQVDDLSFDLGVYLPTAEGEEDEPEAPRRVLFPLIRSK